MTKKKTDQQPPVRPLLLAYHEAGHAVVGIALGLAVKHVEIGREGTSLGRCLAPTPLGYHAASRREQRSIARDEILATYAGLAAERLIDPDAPDYHGADDDEYAFDLSRQFEVMPRRCSYVGDDAHDAYLARLRREAGRLVLRHRSAIAALAETLLQRKRLEGPEVEAIVKPLLA
jgi:ATP-dependent Zn protease